MNTASTRRPLPRWLGPVLGLVAGLVVGLVVAACTSAPSTPRPLLNSERIEATFGSYGVEILHATERLRLSSLYSLEGGRHVDRRVSRTLAVVQFPDSVDPRVAAAHGEIVDGASIGSTLRAHGWSVSKQHLLLDEIEAAAGLQRVYALMEVPPGPLAVDVYRLTAMRDDVAVAYATLAEVHHPDYLDLEALRALFDPDRTLKPESTIAEVTSTVIAAVAVWSPDAVRSPGR
ncbi:MAG: hypothetical protein AAGC60_05210 [Acidobacteriota bacterium]